MQSSPVLRLASPGFQEVTLTDHQFAQWLRDHKWTNDYHHVANATFYHGPGKGETIAMTLTDNQKCTLRVFVKEGA